MTASPQTAARPFANDVGDTYWLPFTAMRQFRANPMMFVGAEGMHYTTADGRRVLDAMAGLWCVNAGHAQPPRSRSPAGIIAPAGMSGAPNS